MRDMSGLDDLTRANADGRTTKFVFFTLTKRLKLTTKLSYRRHDIAVTIRHKHRKSRNNM